EVLRPLQASVASTPPLVTAMLRHFLRQVLGWQRVLRPLVNLTVPVTLTAVERDALLETVIAAGGRPRLVPTPVAAARAMGASGGRMVVDIGATRTEAAIVYDGDILASASAPLGGNSMDASIVRFLRHHRGFWLAAEQAEALKQRIGTASPLEVPMEMSLTGRDVQHALPLTATVTSEEVREALQQPLEHLSFLIRGVLSRTPPELATELIQNGILLIGGGSLLRGLPAWLQTETGVPVTVAPDPETCAVRGVTGRFQNLTDSRPGNRDARLSIVPSLVAHPGGSK
ncbi:MAG: rod shape-determining protein, partial [Candidatus Xenobia bacterium]